MCKFCDNIYKDKESYLKENEPYDFFNSQSGAYYNKSGLVNYYVYCDDPYYSKVELMSMRYCPYCGKDLRHPPYLDKNV